MKRFIYGLIAVFFFFSFASSAQSQDWTDPFSSAQSGNWTGLYVGLDGGYASGDFDVSSKAGLGGQRSVTEFDGDGAVVGGHVGFNVQQGSFVFGAELSAMTANDIEGENFWRGNFFPTNQGSRAELEWLGLLSARVGYASDQWMIYAIGGFAGGKIDSGYCGFGGCNDSLVAQADKRHWGWHAGAGVQYKVTPNLSFGVEYLYVDLDKAWHPNTDEDICGECERRIEFETDVVRASINIHFVRPREAVPLK